MKRILVVTGEESGDKQFSFLWSKLAPYMEEYSLWGIGGKYFKAIGGESVFSQEKLSVMGVTEVLKGFSNIYKAYKTIINHDYIEYTDAVILVDFPDFNFKVGNALKKRGKKVFYFISPKIWAWRSGRIKTIKKISDLMLLIFPFEKQIFNEAGIDNIFVGNPVVYEMKEKIVNLKNKKNEILLLPGSRKSEVEQLLPVMFKAVKIIRHYGIDMRVNIPVSNSISVSLVEKIIREYGSGLNISYKKDSLYEFISRSKIAVSASGTVNLELAVAGVPQVVIYKVANATYLIGKTFVKLDYMSPVNIVLNTLLVPELLQDEANEENISKEIYELLENSYKSDTIIEGYKKMVVELTENIDYKLIADLIKKRIE